ncbi:hypothetical protein E2C01_062653 [Portunus trituberculatus]|uniref:Uncharacterized protein n=1 Tax=Portunus trituberculatus TaxID=210409 RepID=A0A5B7H6Z3_PORTR|nr:hypothetical protein [Portunus trituberculatus]
MEVLRCAHFCHHYPHLRP